jgi:hypothetical protein
MQANPLFRIAAIFNFVVGATLLLDYPFAARVLGIEGPPSVFFHIAAGIVLVFGYAYWCIAGDPARFRPYVTLGACGKMVFVVTIYAHWLTGGASTAMALLVTADLVFAVLFVLYLRSSRGR